MTTKPSGDAFTFYFSLGPGRSYADVAREFGISRRTVLRRAKAEDWKGRIDRIEAEARVRIDKKVVESIEEMSERHLKILRAIQGKALATLQRMELTDAMDAVRALDLTVKAERILRGDGSDQEAERIKELHREEIQTLLVRKDSSPVERIEVDDEPEEPDVPGNG